MSEYTPTLLTKAKEVKALPVGAVVLSNEVVPVAWQKIQTSIGPRWMEASRISGTLSGELLVTIRGPLCLIWKGNSYGNDNP